MGERDNLFDDDEPETQAVETDAAIVAGPVVVVEPVEGETGEDTAPPADVIEADKRAPLSALLDERDKRKAAQAEAETFRKEIEAARARIAEMEQSRQAAPRQDFGVDQRVEALVYDRQLKQSRFMAEREFGKEQVEEAFAFFDRPENHTLSTQFQDAPSPFHAAVEFYGQLKAAREIGDPTAFRDRVKAELRAEWEAEQAALVQAPPKPRPPVSLAGAPAAGRDMPPVAKTSRTFGEIFDS